MSESAPDVGWVVGGEALVEDGAKGRDGACNNAVLSAVQRTCPTPDKPGETGLGERQPTGTGAAPDPPVSCPGRGCITDDERSTVPDRASSVDPLDVDPPRSDQAVAIR